MGRWFRSDRGLARLGIALSIGALAIAAALVWASTESSRSPAAPLRQPPPPTVKGNRALLVGDSLVWAATQPVTDALRADGWEPTIAAAPATTVGDWVPTTARRVADVQPDVVVVELGTNDCNGPCPDLASDIDALLRALPRDVPILWLDVQTQPSYPQDPERVNDALAAAAARWPTVTLVPMNDRFRDHPEWHQPDGLHLNEAGSLLLADLIRESLDAAR